MRKWTERTGVYDDICYLRQAHLLQRFGVSGIDTNLDRDDDGYFARLAREIGFADWSVADRLPCHRLAGNKYIIQYPPGTGFALSIFPAGFQRVSLYAVANVVTLFAALAAIWSAASRRWIALAGVVGLAALYFMINPAKASFSIAPTLIVCAICGYLTNILANSLNARNRIIAAAALGFLLGLAVSFRIPNLFLSAGYFAVLLALGHLERLAIFGLTYGLGLLPTLLANSINAGGILKTTYGPGETLPPDLSFSIAIDYLSDMQGALTLLIIFWAACLLVFQHHKTAASIVAVNLITNLAFFLSHPIFTPYYLMPIAMLSVWTLLATTITSPESKPARLSSSPALPSVVS
ncbi:hypothetical protein IVA88_14960 [Bradyrhizobium sp. 149]|uniref:hypothetical protein n=1 Tax=Bradyrhizobium sp. 149 TaxID=2782624 RepID=UPI001FF7DAAD|nr:hypothetical protein [Bradyrhizobium sp. 149]MCK1652729.1 hypothetical protein [Bradyrhizobium sp. 149]